MKVLSAVLWGAFFVSFTFANTEKIIFKVQKVSPHDDCSDWQSLSSKKLVPPFTQIRDVILPNEYRLYKLDGLQEDSTYELRVSYPAITPTDFSMKVVGYCKTENKTRTHFLSIGAKATGVSPVIETKKTAITFDLVLEPLYLGLLFYTVYKLVIIISVVLCFGVFVVLPNVKALIKTKTL
ncbi:hypothetical protein BY458DRAFT_495699 [Sporodiniella umbellata]|nr:hypothetical protein BY458DRAFT_495699 [Sporodiniella umbellata]